MPDRRELSASEIQSIKNLLIEPLNGHMGDLKESFENALTAQTALLTERIDNAEAQIEQKLDSHDARLKKVEGGVAAINARDSKVLFAWTGLFLVLSPAWAFAIDWLKSRLGIFK